MNLIPQTYVQSINSHAISKFAVSSTKHVLFLLYTVVVRTSTRINTNCPKKTPERHPLQRCLIPISAGDNLDKSLYVFQRTSEGNRVAVKTCG